jgi:hypothetical protein
MGIRLTGHAACMVKTHKNGKRNLKTELDLENKA